MADSPRRSLGQFPDPWSRVPTAGVRTAAPVVRARSRPHPTGAIASVYAWFEMSLGIVVTGVGIAYWYLASSPSQADNPFADLGVVFGVILALLGCSVTVVFAVAARALWTERPSGPIVMIVPNAIALLFAVPQITTSPIALSVALVAGLGAVASGAVVAHQHTFGAG